MRRSVAVTWHASFSVIAAILYFFFVLPRWYELMGETSHTLGTVVRIVAGALIGLAALPVVFTLQRTRRPEFQTPQLALSLRTWSTVLHLLAGLLIIGAAVSEIWLDLDSAGTWLFGIYGAAAAIAVLGVLTFHLAFVAELPPPPPKPLKPKKTSVNRRGRKKADAEDTDAEDTDAEAVETEDTEDTVDADDTVADETAEEPAADQPAEVTAEELAESDAEEKTLEGAADQASDQPAGDQDAGAGGRLRNRRPSGTRRRRLRGGVAVED
ncbi:hypothetical protein AB0K11_24190 [Mycobacterium sp. NPDC050551]|uniref:hypothetical protein n=1 Tax=Mycobacterium sp. NPDC050551 TaxID=3155407 RepID=UPI003438196A